MSTNEKGDQKHGVEDDLIPLRSLGNSGDAVDGWAEFNPHAPTLSEGWRIVVRWRCSPDFGIEVTELTLKPTEWVVDGAPTGFARHRRLPEESPPRGIDKAAIGLLAISKIREGLREFVETSASEFRKAAEQAEKSGRPNTLLEEFAKSLEVPVTSSRGRPPKTSTERARMAVQVLETIEKGKPLYETLAVLWDVKGKTVQNFWLPKLRNEGFLAGLGRSMVAGKVLEDCLDNESSHKRERKETGDG